MMLATFWSQHGTHLIFLVYPLALLVGGGYVYDNKQQRESGVLATIAAATLGAAFVHLWVMPEHFDESVLYGSFFLLCAACQVGAVLLLLARPARKLIVALGLGTSSILVTWLMSRLVWAPRGTESFGALDLVASGCELVAALGCLYAVKAGATKVAWRWWAILFAATIAVSIGLACALVPVS